MSADRPHRAGLAPRPVPDPVVLAVIAAAVDQAWPRPVAFADAADPAHRVWRFSGRWWNKPTPMRRERPYTPF
jgi:hypothetical protein